MGPRYGTACAKGGISGLSQHPPNPTSSSSALGRVLLQKEKEKEDMEGKPACLEGALLWASPSDCRSPQVTAIPDEGSGCLNEMENASLPGGGREGEKGGRRELQGLISRTNTQ